MAINTKIQLRRDTLQNWTTINPTLSSGEVALVDKNNGEGEKLWVIRIGDGQHQFTDLPEIAYALSSDVSGSIEELGNLELSVSTLSAEISSKVRIENVASEYINISRVDAETYHQLVAGGSLDEKTVYIVSSDNINAFGERVINVGDAVDLSDAVNLKQLSSVSCVLSASLSSLTDSLSDYVIGVTSLGRTGDVYKYQLTQGGQDVGEPIEVPYDVFVDKGEISTIDNKKYLLLTLNNATSTVLSIETTDLVDVYTGLCSETISVGVDNYKISAIVNDASITTSKIALSAINSDRITHDAITNDKIADDAIQTENILDDSVTPAKLYQDGLFVFDCGDASSNEEES